MEETISKIVEEWFLTEPLLFSAWCTHTLAENTRMNVPMRTGKMRIEYNSDMMKDWGRRQIEERLRFEIIRILLGHPYQRQPHKAKKATLGIASDVTLTSSYHNISTISLPKGLRFNIGLCFEEYYAIVKDFLDTNMQSLPYDIVGEIDDGGGGQSDDAESGGESDGSNEQENDENGSGQNDDAENRPCQRDEPEEGCKKNDREEQDEQPEREDDTLQQVANLAAESAELWEEDQLASEQLKETVRRAQRCRQWGSIGGRLKEKIEATTIVRIDYRSILSGFRASVLSSKRSRTRMIPSRRYGFQYMGSKRDFATRLLVAVDVSGSVNNRQVSQALSIINRFFKYGVECIDIIQFDVGLQGDVLTMKKARKSLKISGRGGTDFQAPFDFFFENRYDGLIMITDGYAPKPSFPKRFHGNILWMIYNEDAFGGQGFYDLDDAQRWIASMPRSKYTVLPPI